MKFGALLKLGFLIRESVTERVADEVLWRDILQRLQKFNRNAKLCSHGEKTEGSLNLVIFDPR